MLRHLRAALAQFCHRAARADPDGASPASGRTSILGVLCDAHDRALVEQIAQRRSWRVKLTDDAAKGSRLLRGSPAHIVLFDRDFGDGEWRTAIADLAGRAHGACIVLVSRVLDDSLWAEVVSNGGYEVIAKPLREEELLRAVRLARSYLDRSIQPAAARRPAPLNTKS